MSNDNINFNDLWSKQTAVPPKESDILKKAAKLKRQNTAHLVFITGLFFLTSLLIIWIWLSEKPQMLSTRLGIVLCLLAMAVYGLIYNQQYAILKKLNVDDSNQVYLQNLYQLKKHQKFMHGIMLNVYFILLPAGVLLYMIEPVQRMEPRYAILSYLLAVGWILFAWFYLRPKQIKKQQNRLNEIIDKMQSFSNQLSK